MMEMNSFASGFHRGKHHLAAANQSIARRIDGRKYGCRGQGVT